MADDYWRALFRATYRAELRVEAPGREDSILAANPAHFDGLLARGAGFGQDTVPRRWRRVWRRSSNADERRRILRWWNTRRRLGKLLNAARLVRANSTFAGAPRYIAWKIERHTGVAVEMTPWREKHPLLAAPGVLWRVWRARRDRR